MVVIDGQTFSNDFVITEDSEMPLSFFARKRYDGMNNFAKVKLYRAWHKNASNVLDFDVVPVKNPNGVLGLYDMVSGTFYDNEGTGDFVAGPNATDPITLTVVGTTETIATKADSAVISTATCVDLLGVGDYADEQEVIAGNVTRKVGIKALDGTEAWASALYPQTNAYRISWTGATAEFGTIRYSGVWCTHFEDGGSASTTAPSKIFFANDLNINFPMTSDFDTRDKCVQWLADQYAAGTPVIVVYPLAESTTETTTGQDMEIADGDNTVEITQASLDGLKVGLTYMKEEA